MSDIFDNSDAMNDEGPFAPLDAYGGLELQRRQRAIRLPVRRQPASPLGNPVVEQKPLATGPAPARQPLGEAPPYGPLTEEQAQAPQSRPLQQLRYELEHPVTVNQPHGLKAFGEGLLSVLFPRAEQFIQQRRYAPMLGQQERERNLQTEAQLLAPQAQPAPATVESGGLHYQYNPKTDRFDIPIGERKPAEAGKTAQEQAFAALAAQEGPVQAYKDILAMGQEKGAGSPTAHITRMENGKPMLYGWNAKSQKYDIPLGQAPPTFAETQLSDVVVLPTPDGMKAFGYDRRSNTLRPINIPASAGAGAGAPLPKDAQRELDTSMATARGANVRLDVMQQAEPLALHGDQQAMLNILANHIGMTLGLQKGARITQAMYNEAMASAPITGRVEAHFDNRGYLTGVVLTPEQIKQMLRLGEERRVAEWRNVYATGKQYGLSDAQALGNLPTDIRPQAGEGAGAGFGGTAAPTEKKKPWEHYR